MKDLSIHVKRALKTAEAEAVRAGSDCVDTQHLLLGMLAEADGTAMKILQGLSCDVPRIREQLQRTRATASSKTQGQSLPQSTALRRAMENAVADAQAGNAASIGTEHLLLAFLRQPDSMACQVLKKAGATVEGVRAGVDAENARSGDTTQR